MLDIVLKKEKRTYGGQETRAASQQQGFLSEPVLLNMILVQQKSLVNLHTSYVESV